MNAQQNLQRRLSPEQAGQLDAAAGALGDEVGAITHSATNVVTEKLVGRRLVSYSPIGGKRWSVLAFAIGVAVVDDVEFGLGVRRGHPADFRGPPVARLWTGQPP
jgi:hypothetical protein